MAFLIWARWRQILINEAKPTNDATNNITFDTLLDTQFFASKINKAVELQSQVGAFEKWGTV